MPDRSRLQETFDIGRYRKRDNIGTLHDVPLLSGHSQRMERGGKIGMHVAGKNNSRQTALILLFAVMTFLLILLGSPAASQTTTGQCALPTRLQSVVASVSELATGKLLVANRRALDPNFAETVILLLTYSQDGAVGVVINRPTTVPLTTVLSKVKALKNRKDLVYIGGPVGRDQLLLLARTTKAPEGAKQIVRDVYLVSGQDSLQQLVGQSDSSLALRAYVGYAGWAPHQLDAEVARGDWHIDAADATVVFDTPAEQLWPQLINHSEFEWAQNLQNHERTAYSLY